MVREKNLRYLSEFRRNWPNLLGAALGLGFGAAINHYMMNLFGPALIAEFGWTKAQFALVGSLGLITLPFALLAGYIADRFGARTAAIIGFSVVPASFFILSLMSGNIYQFYAILMVKNAFGILTATMVFTRVAVERFERARGLALACLLSCPPLVGAIAAPIIGHIIEVDGWRAGYQALALASAVGGVLAILLIGRSKTHETGARERPKLDRDTLVELCGKRVFVLLMAGMFLVNLPQVLVSSQMSIMMMENGATMGFATLLVSIYALTVVCGRFMSGFALDRVPAHWVAIVALGLPVIGYLALASTLDMRWLLALSIALVGLAQGAETDIAAVLTSRRFSMAHYSFAFSLLMISMSIASALGSVLLSVTLGGGGNFNSFLVISAIATLGGALCFFLTGAAVARASELKGEPA